MASKNLFFSNVLIEGQSQSSHTLPFPTVPKKCPKRADGLPRWYQEVAVLAWPSNENRLIPDLSQLIDLSDRCKDGLLKWSPPKGKWQVVRFICSNNGQELIAASPNSKGLFIDFLDPQATQFHFEYILKKLGLKKGGDPGSPLKTLDDDSMELYDGIQWTPKFPAWFRKYHGYDPIVWLPVLMGWTIESESVNKRFQYDYLKTVSELLIHSHYKTGSKVCAEYGVQLTAEAGGPGSPFWDTNPVDALKALGNVGIPRGEFWLGNPRNLFLVKEIASAAHIYGKKYVDAESWTTWRRWRDGPFTLKKLVDRAFCEGLNRVTYHGFSNSSSEYGFPGRSYHAGVDMNPQITWWSKAKPFMDYLSRCSQMLQFGKFVADVAYYYGDQAPNFWPLYHNVPEKPRIEGLESSYEYDVVNTDIILNKMSVKNGKIMLPHGICYQMLVIPEMPHIPMEVLKKLDRLVFEGATIIASKPSQVPGLYDYKSRTIQLRKLAQKMWGQCNGTTIKVNTYGKGKIVWGYTAQEWLNRVSIKPDFSYQATGDTASLDFIHRTSERTEIYFISNKTMNTIHADCSFRVNRGRPETWDPIDGTIKKQLIYKTIDGITSMPLVLPPGGSVFVVFDITMDSSDLSSLRNMNDRKFDNLPKEQVVANTKDTTTIQCWQDGRYLLSYANGITKPIGINNLPDPYVFEGDWIVKFDSKWGAPAQLNFSKLISWTDHADEGVKHYSGTGTYYKSFDVPDDWIRNHQQWHLDLGEVREVAEIFVNGQSAGILWKPPFMTEVTPFLKPGKNEIKIEVINLWINRLTGDINLPDDKKFTKTNIRSDGATPKVKAVPWHVERSGLMGPVRLIPSVTVDVIK